MGNQENTCSESGSCASSVKFVRLSLVHVRVFQIMAVLQCDLFHQIFLHRDTDMMSRVNLTISGGAAMANAD